MIGTVFKRDLFEKGQIENFQIKFRKLISQELIRARAQGKKLLVLIGETHNQLKILALQEIICEIAAEVGIKSELDEMTQETVQAILGEGRVDDFAKFYQKLIKLGMTVEGIDPLRIEIDKYRSECGDLAASKGVDLRNGGMKNEVFKRDKDAIMFVGSNHLKGLLEERDNSLSEKMGAPKKYHILPMNLSSLLFQAVDTTKDQESVLRNMFALDKDKVIQIPNLNIDEAEADKAIARWNNTGTVEQEFKESKEEQEVEHLNQQRIAREKTEAQAKALREQEDREFALKLQIDLDLEEREAERKVRLEAERQEGERKAKLEAERQEGERKAKLEAERRRMAEDVEFARKLQAQLEQEVRIEAKRKAEADRQAAEAARQRQVAQQRELSDMLFALSLQKQENADARLAQELAEREKAIRFEKSQRNNNQ